MNNSYYGWRSKSEMIVETGIGQSQYVGRRGGVVHAGWGFRLVFVDKF